MSEMKESFSTINYDQLLDDLNTVKQWLESLGRRVANTRFDTILKNVAAINDHDKTKSLDRLIESVGDETICYSLTESIAFVEIFKTFRHLSPSIIPKAKLKDILGGPFLPSEEVTGTANVNNRNILFELELAAKLMDNKIEVKGFDDFEFSYEGKDYFIQCKRPFSERNFEDNIINNAVEKLEQKLVDDKQAGIIAISLEKLVPIDEQFQDLSQIKKILEPIGAEFIKTHEHYWKNIDNPKIIIVLLVFKFVVRLLKENLLTTCFLRGIRHIKSKTEKIHEYQQVQEILLRL